MLGFNSVRNELRDFYADIAAGTVPAYDVLVTNPPYSADHMQRLLQFVSSSGRPWALLVPNYVYTKDYFASLCPAASAARGHGRSQADAQAQARSVFYLCPARRYLYTTPKGRRQEKSAKYTSPFPTFWYCSLLGADSQQQQQQQGMHQAERGAGTVELLSKQQVQRSYAAWMADPGNAQRLRDNGVQETPAGVTLATGPDTIPLQVRSHAPTCSIYYSMYTVDRMLMKYGHFVDHRSLQIMIRGRRRYGTI